MKKAILFLLFAISTFTVSAQDTTRQIGFIDTVKGAIIIEPVVISALQKDTAYQLTWSVFNLSRDTGRGCDAVVVVYKRTKEKLLDMNCPIPWSIVKDWGISNTLIDDFILGYYGLRRKQ